MIEHLPWIVAGLAVGLFVGYAFGKYRGASQVSDESEDEPSGKRALKEGETSSEAEADSTVTVYIRRGGTHFHKEGCRHLRGRSQPVTRAAALKQRFKECPSCHP